MAAWYFPILWTHIGCAVASVSLFAARGGMALRGMPAANGRVVRRVAVMVDTLLLAAGIALSGILGEYPLQQSWLTVVVALLFAYIALGVVVLRTARTRRTRSVCFVAALVVFGLIVSVAQAQSPWGPLSMFGV